MNLTRPSLIEHIAICTKLKKATAAKVRELQEQETKVQNELIVARQLDNFLDIVAEMCYSEISRLDAEGGQ